MDYTWYVHHQAHFTHLLLRKAFVHLYYVTFYIFINLRITLLLPITYHIRQLKQTKTTFRTVQSDSLHV